MTKYSAYKELNLYLFGHVYPDVLTAGLTLTWMWCLQDPCFVQPTPWPGHDHERGSVTSGIFFPYPSFVGLSLLLAEREAFFENCLVNSILTPNLG
jgi:hypothetical protein